MVKIVHCDRSDAEPILGILNEAIINSTALYDYVPRTSLSMQDWFETKEKKAYPVIGIKDDHGEMLAFGSYGQFRAWPAYKYTVEHSLYVRVDQRGRGYGGVVLRALEEAAIAQGYHCLIGGIDAANEVSIRLHKAHAFVPCGLLREVGFKFGRWLDLALYQKILPGPKYPEDG